MAMKKGAITRRRIMETVLTVEKFQPIFEDIEDLIKSAAKGIRTEFQREFRGVKNEIRGVKDDIRFLQAAAKEHTVLIKENGRSIKKLEEKTDEIRTELKRDMHQMEARLSEKIDGNSRRLDDHETRITT